MVDQALIERLEKATGPDRELDALIEQAVHPDKRIMFDPGSVRARRDAEYGVLRDFPMDRQWSDWASVALHVGAAAYTSSIDAALTLVPEGWEWMVSNRAPKPHAGRAYIYNRELVFAGFGSSPNPKRRHEEVTAVTPAIALCIAALKARSALASNERRGGA